ncbi:MAG: hypothetical protein IT303_07765 [Dehalococcoidia bacterium]|nr:hypothetical protein [Dehalococcoidia bacterium]
MAGIGTDAITGLQNATYTPKTSSGGELSQVDFMKLIIAQMRNQNPLEPQSDSDFMAQMAQFESLNQMRAVADGIKVMQGISELSTAAGMLGKTITGRQVQGVSFTRDTVARETFGVPYTQLTTSQQVNVNADDRVRAAVDDTANVGNEVTGRVDRVFVGGDGIPMLIVGGKVVDMFTVTGVA